VNRKKIARQVYLTAEQDAAIRALSSELGIPQAALFREGMDRALAWRRESRKATSARVAMLIARGSHDRAPELSRALAAELRTMLELTYQLRQECAEADDRAAQSREHLRQIAQGIDEQLGEARPSRWCR